MYVLSIENFPILRYSSSTTVSVVQTSIIERFYCNISQHLVLNQSTLTNPLYVKLNIGQFLYSCQDG